MKNEYLNDLDAIIKRAQKDALREVDERLDHRWAQIERILTNGRPIWVQTCGDRFDRIYSLRRCLMAKMETISKAKDVIFEIMCRK